MQVQYIILGIFQNVKSISYKISLELYFYVLSLAVAGLDKSPADRPQTFNSVLNVYYIYAVMCPRSFLVAFLVAVRVTRQASARELSLP